MNANQKKIIVIVLCVVVAIIFVFSVFSSTKAKINRYENENSRLKYENTRLNEELKKIGEQFTITTNELRSTNDRLQNTNNRLRENNNNITTSREATEILSRETTEAEREISAIIENSEHLTDGRLDDSGRLCFNIDNTIHTKIIEEK